MENTEKITAYENIRLILHKVLGYEEIREISSKLECSPSKINSYLRGLGTNKTEFEKIIDTSYEIFVNKYSKMIKEISKSKMIISGLDED